MKIYFTTMLATRDYTRFAFRFGPRGKPWFEHLSINAQEFERNKLVYTDVKCESLRKVYANFCRRMKMEGKG